MHHCSKTLRHGTTESSGQACTPGALATLQGKGLDRGGDDFQVLVNGAPVPVVSRNAKRVVFQCPNTPAGTALAIQTKRGSFWSNILETTMAEASPEILPIDGSSSAQVGEEIFLMATGLGLEALQTKQGVQLVIGDVYVLRYPRGDELAEALWIVSPGPRNRP